ncbi:MAG TPA: NUDIX hydrolase [bacterium]|nr:NUDIX hydrolase [bacterium]
MHRISAKKTNEAVVKEHSAGGIVYQQQDGMIQVAIIYREYHHDWTLPKGHLEEGETAEQAALREVNEEAGLICEIIAHIGHSVYRFRNKHKQLIEKRVDYYLMKLLKDEQRIQLEEIDTVIWLPFMEAVKKLSFKRDRELVQRAVAQIPV